MTSGIPSDNNGKTVSRPELQPTSSKDKVIGDKALYIQEFANNQVSLDIVEFNPEVQAAVNQYSGRITSARISNVAMQKILALPPESEFPPLDQIHVTIYSKRLAP